MPNIGKEATFLFLNSITSDARFIEADLFRIYGYKHNYFLHRGKNYDSALAYADSMINIIKRHPSHHWDAFSLINANNAKADAYFFSGRYSDAYIWYNKNKEQTGLLNPRIKGVYSFRIAMALYKAERYKDAAEHFKESFALSAKHAKRKNQHARIQETLNNIGLSYFHLNKHDSSLAYYNKALIYIDKIKVENAYKHDFLQAAKAVIQGNIGDAYAATKNYDSAEAYLKKSIIADSTLSINSSDMYQKKINLADVYFIQGQHEKTKQILKSVSTHIESQTELKVRYSYYNTLWKYYKYKGNDKQGFKSLQKYLALKDALYIQKKAVLIDDLRKVVRENEIEIFIQNRKLKNRYIIALISTCISMTLAIIWLISLILKRKKSIKNQKQVLEEIAWLHSHKIRKPVATMMGLLNIMNKEHTIDPENKFIIASLSEQLMELDEYIKDVTKKTNS